MKHWEVSERLSEVIQGCKWVQLQLAQEENWDFLGSFSDKVRTICGQEGGLNKAIATGHWERLEPTFILLGQ